MNSPPLQPTISVLIPTFNGEKTLEELFATLHRQTLKVSEILVADSSSSDMTVDVCKRNGAKVWSISKNDFDHGGTRSFLAEKASGDIVVFFTQDATPATRDALSLLVKPLLENESCACSYGRQLPRPDAHWHASYLRKFNYPVGSSVKTFSDREKIGLRTIFTSNSFAAYNRNRLLKVGCFKNGLIFGEDTCTVGRLLEAGYTNVYVGEAAVYHSHNYSLTEEFRRSFDIGVLHSSEKWLLNTFGKAENIGFTYVKSAIHHLAADRRYILILSFIARTGVKLLGYKLGRIHERLPLPLRPVLSMHTGWWQKRN
jgi:rhamnosyltransferase